MKEIKFYNSVWMGLAGLLGSLYIFFISRTEIYNTFISSESKSPDTGLSIALIFFGFCAIMALSILLDRRPKIIISKTGFREAGYSVSEIRWEEVKKAETSKHLYFFRFLTLHVDTLEPRQKLFGFNIKSRGSFRIKTLLMNTFTLQINVFKVADLINKMVEAQPEDRAKLLDGFKK